jgi:hypothetical protein
VAGLKPAIHDKMMKGMPICLWDAFEHAITLDKNCTLLKTNMTIVNEIDENHDSINLDVEIEGVQAQLNRLNSKKITVKTSKYI